MAETTEAALGDDVLRIFILELVNQANAAKLSAEDYNAARDRVSSSFDPDDQARCFLGVQGMLTAAALMSKILHASPAKPKWCSCTLPDEKQEQHTRAVARCAAVRAAIGVTTELQSRKVRNSFEHFDDRLDSFVSEGAGNFADRFLGSRDLFVVEDGEPFRYLRQIDPTTPALIVSVLDDELSLQELMNTIVSVGNRAFQWLEAERERR